MGGDNSAQNNKNVKTDGVDCFSHSKTTETSEPVTYIYLVQCDVIYVNACLINCWLFIHFLVRLRAPKLPQQYDRAARPASLSTWHGRARTSAVFVVCTIRLVQNVWATLCRRSVHASSRTTTKAAPHTQCDGCGLLYGYMGTHPSRRSRYGWL